MIGSAFDNGQAIDEGWSIFECFGSENGPWQIQKMDDAGKFNTDIDVWRLVVTYADAGSVYHQRALQFIKDNNPMEYDCIVDTIRRRAIA
ncbi:hypothetical protein [Bradyrhizobium sp. DASA03007]|uniref:hypothetical protein n=1 Tax=unclassified Bradyrhizobium TaxID=2631580 RepID=UPI003F71EE3E